MAESRNTAEPLVEGETVGATLQELAAAAQSDVRPHLPEPPPVRLVTVNDVSLPAVAGLEVKLDAFYVDLLRFEREPECEWPTYLADNHAVRFRIVESPPERDECRPLGVQTPFYDQIIETLEHEGVDFEVVRGLVAGNDAILLRDPAGNWLAVAAWREVR